MLPGLALLRDHDGEALADEVVGDLVDLAKTRDAEAVLLAGRLDGGVEGILDPRLQRGVQMGEAAHLRGLVALRVHRRAERDDTFREGARLVRAQDVHAAQVLDRFQPPHDHPALRHHPRAAGEGDADDGGQQLGRDAHGQGHREQQRLDPRPVQQEVDGQDEENHHRHHAQEQGPELPDAAGELRLRSAREQSSRDGTEGGGAPGLHDQDLRRSAPHRGSQEHRVGTAGDGRVRRQHARQLLDGKRLPGERRLGDQEVAGLQDQAVGGDQVSGREQDHIAGDEVAGGHGLDRAVAQRLHGESEPLAELGHRGGRPVLLREAEKGAAHHDGEDDRGVHPLADEQGHEGAEDENEDERAFELAQEQPKGGDLGLLFHRVGAMALPPPSRFRRGQALGDARPGRPSGQRLVRLQYASRASAAGTVPSRAPGEDCRARLSGLEARPGRAARPPTCRSR